MGQGVNGLLGLIQNMIVHICFCEQFFVLVCVQALEDCGLFVSTYLLDVYIFFLIFLQFDQQIDRLCGLVARVSAYRYRGLGFDSRRYQIF